MRTLTRPPEIDDRANFLAALEVGDTKTVLQEHRRKILLSYTRYKKSAPLLSSYNGPGMPEAAKNKMLNLYERTNGGSLSSLREILKANCRRCPFCNISTACELDHFLAKDEFPSLAIFSWNLIPTCPECNKLKLGGQTGGFIHSYYDVFPNLPFLIADVTLEPGLVLTQFRLELAGIPGSLASRIQSHFDVLELANRYSLEAQDRLSAFRLSLPNTYAAGGVAAVRVDLERKRAEASLYGINHWETALLTSLIASGDYCDDGFSGLIPNG